MGGSFSVTNRVLPIPATKIVVQLEFHSWARLKSVYRFSRTPFWWGTYPLVVKQNRHELATMYVVLIPGPFWPPNWYQKAHFGPYWAHEGEVRTMRESEEKGAPGGGRFDLLLKQLGAGVVAESPGVELPEGGEGEGGGSVRQSSVRSTMKTRWDRSMGWVRSFPSSPIGAAVLPVPEGYPLPEDDPGGLLTLSDVAAQGLGLPVGEPTGVLVSHGHVGEEGHPAVDAPVGLHADGVPGEAVGGIAPVLLPGGQLALVQELDDPVGDGVLDALPGGLPIGWPPAPVA